MFICTEDEELFFSSHEKTLKEAPHFILNFAIDDPNFDQAIEKLFNKFYPSIKQTNLNKLKHKKALKLLLFNLLYCQRISRNTWLAISLSPNSYVVNRYNSHRISASVIVTLKNWMKKNDYILFRKGFLDREKKKSRKSRILTAEKLRKYFNQSNLNNIPITLLQGAETIFLKNNEKKLINYKDRKGIFSMRKKLTLINNTLQKATLSIDANELPPPFLYRIFNDNSFQKGGRFYGGFFQNLKRNDRSRLRINNSSVVECDFQGMHINMLYAQKRKAFEGDPYQIPGYSGNKARKLIKDVVLIMLNTPSFNKALNTSYYNLYRENKKEALLKTKKEFKELMHAIEQKHEPIKHKFYKTEAKKLQYIDSRVAEKILFSLSKKGIPVLPIHDSFIVEERFKNELTETMLASYQKVMRSSITIDCK